MKRVLWLMLSALLVAGCLCAPEESHAQSRCPWLNAATAAGLLGGEVQATVTGLSEPVAGKGVGAAMYPDQVRSDRMDASCRFTRKVDSAVYSLEIVVKTMSDPAKEFAGFVSQCKGTTTALKAIGNEAVQCVMSAGSESLSESREEVIARVRDRVFVLTIRRAMGSPSGTAESGLRDDSRNIAEQVAGSIF